MGQKAIVMTVACLIFQGSFLPAVAATAQAAETNSTADCNPVVQEALLQEASNGAQLQYGIVRNPTNGIKEPESLWNISCLDDLINAPRLNVLIDPDTIASWFINQAKGKLCQAYKEMYVDNIDSPFDPSIFTSKIPRLPGLSVSGGNSPLINGGANGSVDVNGSDIFGTEAGDAKLKENLPSEVQNAVDGYFGDTEAATSFFDSISHDLSNEQDVAGTPWNSSPPDPEGSTQ